MIRPMLASDAAAVAEIFGAAPEAARWRTQDLATLESAGAQAWVEVENEGIIGAVAMREVSGDAEILNLAVAADWRRRGIGKRLMETALEAARERGATRVFLEVRESNAGARAFYARLGFSQDGRRPNYYRDPREDALLLSRLC
jgi:ribosomal-protein-alanine acetyltransferase